MRTRAGVKFTRGPAVRSVKELLGRHRPQLARLTEQAVRQERWRAWLTEVLPAELLGRVSGVNERDDATLVVFAESAAWAARLRYALAEIEPALRSAHPGIGGVEVRVLPRS